MRTPREFVQIFKVFYWAVVTGALALVVVPIRSFADIGADIRVIEELATEVYTTMTCGEVRAALDQPDTQKGKFTPEQERQALISIYAGTYSLDAASLHIASTLVACHYSSQGLHFVI